MKNFLNWMVRNSRLSTNPLAHMRGGNVKVDRRLERRELKDDKIQWLLNSSKSGKVVHGLTGWQRYTLYSVAMGTGLRASELASLTPQSFDLDSSTPTVTIEAKVEKARRGDVLPLPPDLVDLLRGGGKQSSERSIYGRERGLHSNGPASSSSMILNLLARNGS